MASLVRRGGCRSCLMTAERRGCRSCVMPGRGCRSCVIPGRRGCRSCVTPGRGCRSCLMIPGRRAWRSSGLMIPGRGCRSCLTAGRRRRRGYCCRRRPCLTVKPGGSGFLKPGGRFLLKVQPSQRLFSGRSSHARVVKVSLRFWRRWGPLSSSSVSVQRRSRGVKRGRSCVTVSGFFLPRERPPFSKRGGRGRLPGGAVKPGLSSSSLWR